MTKAGKQFLIVIQLGNTEVSRLQSLVPRLQEHLARISTEPVEQAFRSVTADLFGYVIRSRMVAGQIAASIETPQKDDSLFAPTVSPLLDGRDNLFVVELGEDTETRRGFNRLGAWLQHH